MVAIQRLCRTEIHRHAMLHHAIALQDLIQDRERTPAVHHVVLRDDLEPVHHWLALKQVLVVRYPQTYTDSVVGVSIKSIGRHVACFLMTLKRWGARQNPSPPAYLSQRSPCFLEPSVAQPPLPLQEFLPLQPLLPV